MLILGVSMYCTKPFFSRNFCLSARTLYQLLNSIVYYSLMMWRDVGSGCRVQAAPRSSSVVDNKGQISFNRRQFAVVDKKKKIVGSSSEMRSEATGGQLPYPN
jgi:hypothetical protein